MSPLDNQFVKDPALLGTFSLRETVVLPFAPLPPTHRRTSDLAVVTWVAGEKAYEWFAVTGPAMRRYADRVGADLVVLDGYSGQPYLLGNKFRVKQVITEYGYESVLFVDADALIQDHCTDFFQEVPGGQIAMLNEGGLYDEWMLAQYRREALALATSQGLTLEYPDVPSPRNSGLYLLPAEYADVLTPPAGPFPVCGRGGATVEQTWMSLQVARSGAKVFDLSPQHHWLWYADQAEEQAESSMVLHFAGLGDNPGARRKRLLHHGSRSKPSERIIDGRDRVPDGHFDQQLMLHAPATPALDFKALRTIGTHQHGWSVATKALSVLTDKSGVIFDDFVESTFLWHGHDTFSAGLVPYREHWAGFIHNPPGSPDWPSIADEAVVNLSRKPFWLDSLEHCLGLFAMTDYLADWVTRQWGVPCETVRYPTITPAKTFSMEEFDRSAKTVASIGFWLRRYSSFDLLDAPGYRKLRPVPVRGDDRKGIDRVAQYQREERAFARFPGTGRQPVEVCERLDSATYDELLSRSVVFLDLIDASAVTTVVECLVRATPLLVNRIPAVEEYLGTDYPYYFDSLDEATTKLIDRDLIHETHLYLRDCPILEELRPQTFLNRLVATGTYQRALEATAGRRHFGK